jgi:peptidoglycan hydrolase CwlO-like protein
MLDYCTIRAFEAKLDDLEGKLDETLALLRAITQKGEVMSAELDRLQQAVTNCTTVGDSAVALIKGLSAQIAASKNDPAALQAIADRLDAEAAAWKTAVEANTPAAPTTTPPAPAPTPPASAPGGRP